MNISSIVIKVSVNKLTKVLQEIEAAELCEIHISENNKIVATIEADSIEEEVKRLRQIERIDGVTSAQVTFSYNENELDELRNNIELGADAPDWLNKDIKAGQIKYQGDLKKKFGS